MKHIRISKTSYCRKSLLIAISVAMTMLIACGSSSSPGASDKKDTGFIVTKAGMYDSADKDALIVDKNTAGKTITFYNREVKREYTLNYDGTSKVYDKYGTAMSMEQVDVGSIVDITFLKTKRLLNSMQGSQDAWELTQIRDFDIDELENRMYAAGSNYRFDKTIEVYADGSKAELMDINPVDTITVKGVDRMVYSVTIDEGHGYLRLKNEDYFVGGWIEIAGSKIIKTIGEDMIIAVPVGTYDVALSNKGVEGLKTVSIDRNKETELDIGDIPVEEERTYGNIIFVVDPSDAEVFIDGEQVDISGPVKVEYGIHQLIARAAGYQTLTQYIKVGAENATLEITLEGERDPYLPVASPGVSPAVSPTPQPTSSPSTDVLKTGTTINGYKITISTPTGVEVYLDGSYMGIAPVSFTKVSGKHELILRKEGYITRSYTITVDTQTKDEVFSFTDLIPKEGTEAATPTPTPTPKPKPKHELSPAVTPEATPEAVPEVTPTDEAGEAVPTGTENHEEEESEETSDVTSTTTPANG